MKSDDERDQGSLIANMIAGAVAGAVATWAMGKVTEFLYNNEEKSVRGREDAARGDRTAYATAAEKVAQLAGTSLTKKESEEQGVRIHWALGTGAGAFYGALRRQMPVAGAAGGLAFGTAFWALTDEGAVYALGLTPGPTHFPWQTHARGFAGHLVFGAVTDATLSLIQKLA